MRGFRITNNGFRILGTLALMLMLAAPAPATTVVKMDLKRLVSDAESIVQGRVEQVYTHWDADRKMAFTYVSVQVDDPMKGARRRTILIRQMGGTVGSLNVTIAGMPQFSQGEEVILFLKGQRDGTHQVLGLNQGKYAIVNDYAVSHVSGLTLVDPKTGQLSDAGFVEKAPVEEFKTKIRELLK